MIRATAIPPKNSIRGWERARIFTRLSTILKEPVVLFCEAALFVVFHVEGFDDPVSGNGLVEEGGDGAHSLLTLPAEFPEPLSEFLDGDDGQWEDDEER